MVDIITHTVVQTKITKIVKETKMRTREEIEVIVNEVEANIMDVKVTEMRVYINNKWIWKEDFELVVNGTEDGPTADETIIEWTEQYEFFLNKPKSVMDIKKEKSMQQQRLIKFSKGASIMPSYSGICNNPNCAGHSDKFVSEHNMVNDFMDERFRRINLSKAIMVETMDTLESNRTTLTDMGIEVTMPDANPAVRSIDTNSDAFLALTDAEKKVVYFEKSKLTNPILWSTVEDPRISAMWKGNIKKYRDTKKNITACFSEANSLVSAVLGVDTLKGWKSAYNNHLLNKFEEGTQVYDGNMSFVVDIEFDADGVATCTNCGEVTSKMYTGGKVDHLGISQEECRAELLATLDVDKICADVIADIDKHGVFTVEADEVISITDVLAELEASDLVNDILDGKESMSDAEYNGYVKQSFGNIDTLSGYCVSNDSEMDELENAYLNSMYCPWEDCIQDERN